MCNLLYRCHVLKPGTSTKLNLISGSNKEHKFSDHIPKFRTGSPGPGAGLPGGAGKGEERGAALPAPCNSARSQHEHHALSRGGIFTVCDQFLW